jgi:putative ABC transport system permease protein
VAERATDQIWLLEAGPVTWDDVLALNDLGGTVVSRAVISDPPPDSELDPEIASWGGTDDEWLAVVALIVVMALLEVVLLAGPAFAVTARRQSRNLALVAAAGGTPRQGRRVILAHGLVLGSLAAVLGAGLGIAVGRAAVPVVQRYETSWFGPFDVPWLHLLGIVAFGLLSALLAAVVPAWIASRQDVVAVLGGRRGDRRASLRSPVLGVLLLAAGVAGAVYGAKRPSAGEVAITASAVVAVLGMILLVPVVVVALARMGRRLPLVLRYAVRDAARHRTRTVPAVAAVAATVAGVVALGISVSSDELENRSTYTPQLPMGAGVVNFGWQSEVTASEADAVRAAATEVAPGIRATVVDGVRTDRPDGSYTYLSFAAVGGPGNLLMAYGGTLGSDVLVADRVPAADLLGVDPGAVSRADRALAAGGVVALADSRLADEVAGLDRVRTSVEEMDADGNQAGTRRRTFAGAVVATTGSMSVGPQAIVSTEAARRLGVVVKPVGVLLDGAAISRTQQRDLDEAATAIQQNASVYVERGYRTDSETVVVQLVLGALGAVLMLGGTLTATFLALSDARPDLATLAAVGASPRKRRGVAASYALFVGLVGAVLGAAVGFIPGIAVTYPLTGNAWHPDGAGPSHYLDVPWLLVGTVVVALPLLTAAIVWATARSRLPMVARLD